MYSSWTRLNLGYSFSEPSMNGSFISSPWNNSFQIIRKVSTSTTTCDSNTSSSILRILEYYSVVLLVLIWFYPYCRRRRSELELQAVRKLLMSSLDTPCILGSAHQTDVSVIVVYTLSISWAQLGIQESRVRSASSYTPEVKCWERHKKPSLNTQTHTSYYY